MRYLFLISCFFIAFCGGVSAQPDSLMHTTFAKRYDYVCELDDWLSLHENPQVAIDSIQKMVKNVKAAGDDAFAYHLSFILISKGYYAEKPGVIKKFLAQINKAEEEGYIYEATYAKNKLANRLWHDQNRTRAMEIALEAHNTYKNFTIQEFPDRVSAQSMLAARYHFFKEFGKVKTLLLELSAATGGKMTETLPTPTMILALSYRGLKQYDSSLYYFNCVYNYDGDQDAERKRALAAGNIGVIYTTLQDYDSAILWYKRELAIWKQINNNSSLPNLSDYSSIAEAYLAKGNKASAMIYIDSAEALMHKVRVSFIDHKKFYEVKADVLAATGNYATALIYKDSMIMMIDSVHHARDKAMSAEAENRVTEAKHEKEIEYLETLRKDSIWLRNFAIVTILLLAVITSLLINRSRLRHKQKELKAVNEKSNAENKLLQFTRQMQQQNRQIEELKDELQHITDEQDATVKHETIARLQQSTILTDEQWEEFRNVFEEVYSGFISRLKEKFPGLTPAELRYLTLLKLDLTNKEMANILGVNTNTVHNYKSRLRKKYTIPDDASLEDMVKSI